MSNEIGRAIRRGDTVKIKADRRAKYELVAADRSDLANAFIVQHVDTAGGRKRLIIDRSPSCLWAQDCALTYGAESKERRKALGL